jgi:hypothetical protein
MNDLRKTQESFARKAQAQPEHRFGDLYHLICREEWLREALSAVLKNPGSRTAGVDGISRKDLADEASQAKFIQELQAELKAGTYRPLPRICTSIISAPVGKAVRIKWTTSERYAIGATRKLRPGGDHAAWVVPNPGEPDEGKLSRPVR